MFAELVVVAALEATAPAVTFRELRHRQVAAMVVSPATGFVAVTMSNGFPDVVEDKNHNMVAHIDYAGARLTEPVYRGVSCREISLRCPLL